MTHITLTDPEVRAGEIMANIEEVKWCAKPEKIEQARTGLSISHL